MVTYEVFNSLRVHVDVRPTLDLSQKREWGMFYEYDEDGNEYDGDYFEHDHIGKKLVETMPTDLSTEDCNIKEILEDFPSDKLKVKWLNEPVADTKNFQFSYLGVRHSCEPSRDTMLMVPVWQSSFPRVRLQLMCVAHEHSPICGAYQGK